MHALRMQPYTLNSEARRAQANFHTDCRGMQAQLVALSSLMAILDPQLTAHLVGVPGLCITLSAASAGPSESSQEGA